MYSLPILVSNICIYYIAFYFGIKWSIRKYLHIFCNLLLIFLTIYTKSYDALVLYMLSFDYVMYRLIIYYVNEIHVGKHPVDLKDPTRPIIFIGSLFTKNGYVTNYYLKLNFIVSLLYILYVTGKSIT